MSNETKIVISGDGRQLTVELDKMTNALGKFTNSIDDAGRRKPLPAAKQMYPIEAITPERNGEVGTHTKDDKITKTPHAYIT